MPARFAPARCTLSIVSALAGASALLLIADSTQAQNPFAPAPAAPTATGTAPAPAGTAAPAGATVPAPSANPFGAPAPTATPPAPAAAMPAAGAAPAAPGANPFAAPAPAAGTPAPAATTPSAPTANPFSTPAPAPAATMPAAPGAVPAALPPGAAPGATGEALNLPTVSIGGPPPSGGYRVLAPGVFTTIPSPVEPKDRSTYHDVVEVLAENPTYGEREIPGSKSAFKQAYFRHDVWGLTFAFKPIRFLRLRGADGKERLIWYMVYTVKNGPVKAQIDDLQPTVVAPVAVTEPFLFIPKFELESYDVKQVYGEKIIPEAIALIREREDKNRPLLNTVEITGNIPPSTEELDRTVWGVVTWEGVDPRTDRFTIYVQGLTNVYRWTDDGTYAKGDPVGKGRKYHYQVLKLNFWRPSDEVLAQEAAIRFGIPGMPDYEWIDKP